MAGHTHTEVEVGVTDHAPTGSYQRIWEAECGKDGQHNPIYSGVVQKNIGEERRPLMKERQALNLA